MKGIFKAALLCSILATGCEKSTEPEDWNCDGHKHTVDNVEYWEFEDKVLGSENPVAVLFYFTERYEEPPLAAFDELGDEVGCRLKLAEYSITNLYEWYEAKWYLERDYSGRTVVGCFYRGEYHWDLYSFGEFETIEADERKELEENLRGCADLKR